MADNSTIPHADILRGAFQLPRGSQYSAIVSSTAIV